MADKTKIFISYRREDSAYASGSLYGHLVARFGRERVFKDVDAIPAGVDFRQHIRGILAESAVALVVIGRRWLDIALPDGRRRLDDPNDPVRMEIEATLAQGIPIIPLLVDGAGMPHKTQLPESMRAVADYAGLFVRPDPDFEGDVRRVIAAIERWMGGASPTTPQQPTPPPSNDMAGQLLAQIRASFAARDWPDVVRRAELLIRHSPEAATSEVYRLYGLALLETGDNQRAKEALDTALKKEPLHPATMRAAAHARMRLGQPAEAAPLLRDALALSGDRAERLTILGEYAEALIALKQWTELRGCAEEALGLAPGEPRWLEVKLRALTELNRQPEALEVARQLTARPDATAAQWLARARLEVDLGRGQDAIASLQAAARLAPGDAAVAQAQRELFPMPDVPSRLAQLGYRGESRARAGVIVPPVVPVPAGEFLMGSDKQRDAQAYDHELPQHRVTLPAYQIGTFPVTVAEYLCYVRAGGKEPAASGSVTWQKQLQHLDHPVVCVTWRDATAYAAWLAKLTGQPWRLPSEAEWEKAARWDAAARSARIYPWGDQWDKSRCNSSESGIGTTTPVGNYPTGASPCGALDMAGNIWEWTNTLFQSYPYSQSDGREDQNSTGSRVPRGGPWLGTPWNCRAAYRTDDRPDNVNDLIGFRVVLAAPGS